MASENDPLNPNAAPSPTPAPRTSAKEAESVTLATPQGVVFSHPEDAFPEITQEGTSMTNSEAQAAKDCARVAGLMLHTVGGRN